MKKIGNSDLALSILIPIVLMLFVVVGTKCMNTMLWSDGEYAWVYNNITHIGDIVEARSFDGDVVIKTTNDNKWHKEKKLGDYGYYKTLTDALKYDLDYQLLLGIMICSIVFFFVVLGLYGISWSWLVPWGGYWIFLWWAGAYQELSHAYVIMTVMVVCLQMIVWMVNGFWKCHYVTVESETGLIGAWRMLSKENDTEEVWSFQNEKDLYIAKNGIVQKYKWKKLIEQDSIIVTDETGNSICYNYKRNEAKEKKLNDDNFKSEKECKILDIGEMEFVNSDYLEITSILDLKAKKEKIKYMQSVAERLYKMKKRRIIWMRILYIAVIVISLVGIFLIHTRREIFTFFIIGMIFFKDIILIYKSDFISTVIEKKRKKNKIKNK